MAEKDHYYGLFVQAQEKIKAASDTFEENFLWLEEALTAAKLSFAHSHQVLLPKTPAAKKRVRQNRIDTVDSDDGESPSKKPQTESNSQVVATSPECPPPRRGRAASRIAREKVGKSFKESAKRKLRRPSTPEDTSTAKKTKPLRNVKQSKKSDSVVNCTLETTTKDVTAESKDPEVSLDSHNNSNPKVNGVDEEPRKESKLPPKLNETPKKRSNSIGRKLEYASTSDDNVENEVLDSRPKELVVVLKKMEYSDNEGTESYEVKNTNSVVVDGIKKRKSSSISTVTVDSGIHECLEEVNVKKNSIIEVSDTSHCKNDNTVILAETVNEVEVPETAGGESEKVELLPQPEPVAKVRSTRTKQKGVTSPPLIPTPIPRTTRTKQPLESQVDTDASKSDDALVKETNSEKSDLKEVGNLCTADMLPPPEIPKVRSTRTKKKQDESVCIASYGPPMSNLKETNEHSSSDAESVTEIYSSTQSLPAFVPPEVPKIRSTRTKKKQVPDDSSSEGMENVEPKRSTRTKKKMEEEKMDTVNGDILTQSENESSDTSSRSTRTKKRQVEQEVNPPSRSTRTKRKKLEEERCDESDKENSMFTSDSIQTNKGPSTPGSKAERLIQKYQSFTSILTSHNERELEKPTETKTTTNQRLTRSKIRQVPATKVTPKKGSPFLRDCCSPSSENGTPKKKEQMMSRIGSPLRYSPRPNNSEKDTRPTYVNRAPFQKDVLKEVEEIPSNQIEVVHSPVRVTRHSGGKSVKTPDTRWARINPQQRTPSPQCPPDKVVRPKIGQILSTGSTCISSGHRTPKTFSRLKPGLTNSASSSSTEYRKFQKKINTPTEVNRTKNLGNIVTGISSFIKVQAPKPTREDIESKRQLELQKKREREEESRRKKEELLKSKAEEQKRRNEERMKRVKEAREANERKQVQAIEQQKSERKQREERQKEEQQKKKQMLLAKRQAEEELKTRKIKEQMEEEKRQLEEKRLVDEARKVEEAKRREEKLERQRLQEEEERRKKRVAEVERIAREKRELEQLKLREAERLASANKVTAGHTANTKHNETFNKDSPKNAVCNSTFTMGSGSGNVSHEKTSISEKTTSCKRVPDPNNYDIYNIKSDDSTDDERSPKKDIPSWAQGSQLKLDLINQEYYPPNINEIFNPEELLIMPDLMEIFPIARRRFFKRTSSAIWSTPPHKLKDL